MTAPTLCPLCSAWSTGPIAKHMAATHPIDTNGVRTNRVEMPDHLKIGVGRSTLYTLGIWPTPVVSRSAVRALAGTHLAPRRSKSFQATIMRLDREGLVERAGDDIRVLDQPAIFSRALDGLVNPQHEKFIAIYEALPLLRSEVAEIQDARLIEQRTAEIRFIESLMRPYGASMSGRRNPVRVVAAGRVTA